MAYYSPIVRGVAREAFTEEASCFVRGVVRKYILRRGFVQIGLEHYMKEPKKGDVVQAVTTESMTITVES